MTTWNGVNDCYVPQASLVIDPSLTLHREAAESIDPVTYEVIRSALWNTNEEAGGIIRRVSGSPIAQYAHDLNTVLLTEDAEFIYSGPFNLNLAAVIDLTVKWILEYRSGDPGIRDGDIYLSNDPFVGASHVTDAIMAAPIFVDGKLFGWTASSFHQYDLGGSAPGGYSPDARDRFQEADPIPPVRLVEGDGEVRRDLLEWYVRKSRTPQLLELDFRSQIAGCNYAKRRILGLIEAYGAPTVKAAMRKILDDGERAFAARIERVPAGRWTANSYVESALPGDRAVYDTVLTVTKEDGRLTFDQEGTSPQAGVLSISYAAWRAGIIPPLIRLLCDDTQYALGGALRRLVFTPKAGTLMCASHPAATGNPGIGICQAGNLATIALGRMLSTLEDDRQDLFAVSGSSIYPINALSGTDQRGNYFGTIHMEPMAGALGAFGDADGMDTGGTVYDAMALAPNVEYSEQYFPILYLYRRELADSGGAGRFRGGNGGVHAYIPHGTQEIDHYTATSGAVIPTGLGLWGGLPGATNRELLKTDTDVLDQFAAGKIPQDLEQLAGTARLVAPKERDLMQRPSDVWEGRWAAAGGFGDPLMRVPAAVLNDVLTDRVTIEGARTLYGVVIDQNAVDETATADLRSGLIDARKANYSGAAREQIEGKVALNLGPSLALHNRGDGFDVSCRACGTSLGGLSGWKERAAQVETPASEVNPHITEAANFVDDAVVFRTFCCPGCGVALDGEVAVGDDGPFDDIALEPLGS